ncbi:MAG: guanitoxin biosynthesis heme-dependent pre-guanitoxin N-hydroxylase GntA [Chitinophagaceae bacterium]
MNQLSTRNSEQDDGLRSIRDAFAAAVGETEFPCIMARSALANQQLRSMTAGHMACPNNDRAILDFLYEFIDEFKKAGAGYHSAVIIFDQPVETTETLFEQLFWQRLQALADLDARNFGYDKRVSADPMSENFSFSLKEEAFYIIGLHPASSRKARRFSHPAIVFNPHAQFEALRAANKYDKIKQVIRKRDLQYSGSVNPMLKDFGTATEAFQYSGNKYDDQWKCPLHIKHEPNEHHPPA